MRWFYRLNNYESPFKDIFLCLVNKIRAFQKTRSDYVDKSKLK